MPTPTPIYMSGFGNNFETEALPDALPQGMNSPQKYKYGVYNAKPKGFVPSGMSLHNVMLPHGPAKGAFEAASTAYLKAVKLENAMSFMFETRFPQHLTQFAAKEAPLQDNYIDCWSDIEKKFDGTAGTK